MTLGMTCRETRRPGRGEKDTGDVTGRHERRGRARCHQRCFPTLATRWGASEPRPRATRTFFLHRMLEFELERWSPHGTGSGSPLSGDSRPIIYLLVVALGFPQVRLGLC